MSIASNQYASKLFAEHPVAIWPLDDDAYYLSLIDEFERNLSNWNLTNCIIDTTPTLPEAPSPFDGIDNNYFGIIGDHTVLGSSGGTIEIKSDPVFLFNSLNEDLKTFSINFYIYQDSTFTASYEFGFRYFNTELAQWEEILIESPAPQIKSWIRLTETFSISEFDSDTCELLLKINVSDGGSLNDYNFIMNALSVGQWSEPFSSKSLGAESSVVPSSSGLLSVYGVESNQYGTSSDNGYHIIEDGRLLSKNNGVPLVFGSENSVQLIPSYSDLPSFIFPGKGFLSEQGRYKTQTLEFWLRIKPNTKIDKKIFGPLNSFNGIYVLEDCIALSIGDNFKTFNVYEWYRPMLIHILYNETNCQMFINGEQVIELDIDRDALTFQNENQWLGFFNHNEIETFEIDCISIFPYSLPLQVAKRRFVWGQGVSSQQTIDSSFSGTSIATSFPNSNYSVNIVYPDKERWDSGYYNNLTTSKTSLLSPEYSLPEIFLSNRTESLWYDANKTVNNIEYPGGDHPLFVTFRPGTNEEETEWVRDSAEWNEKSYFQFSTANISSSPISSIFGVFEIEDDINIDRPLIHIVNALSGKRFEININSYDLSYVYDENILETFDVSGQDHIVSGIHIPTIIENFGSELSSFFSSYEYLQIYIGGSPDTLIKNYETFEGKIYRISFSDSSNYNEISDHFTNEGFANYQDDSLFLNHYATYTMLPFLRYGKFFLDVSISASWEEYYPLNVLADYAVDQFGNNYYGIDYLQFNVGYPSYYEKNEFGIDTTNSSINIFATFQLISEGANQTLESFPYTKILTNEKVIDAVSENTLLNPYKAFKTKFSIIDGTVIYPPKNIKIEDVSIVIYFSIKRDAILSHPIVIRDMSISSKVLNSSSANPIGTKFSTKIYPYIKRGIYLDHKSKNPILISNKSNPYLYLTENSGIKILGNNENNNERIVSIPINENFQDNIFIAAMQLFLKVKIDDFNTNETPLFEIQYSGSIIEFVAVKDESLLRIKILCRDKTTKNIYENVVFYQNGIHVESIFLENDIWNCIGLIFTQPLDFSLFNGSINLFSRANFENISFFYPEGLNEIFSIINRTWQNVLTEDNINNVDWQYWYDENGLSTIKKWKNVLIFAEEKQYSLTVSDIYKSYLGTNVEVVDDNNGINIFNDDFYIVSNVLWSSTVGKPA